MSRQGDRYGEIDETSTFDRAREEVPCICGQDTGPDARVGNPKCRRHGTDANRHPFWRGEYGVTEAAFNQTRELLKDAVRVDPDDARVRCSFCRLSVSARPGATSRSATAAVRPPGATMRTTAPTFRRTRPSARASRRSWRCRRASPRPSVTWPTSCGSGRRWGVTGHAVHYAATKVWADLEPVLLAEETVTTRPPTTSDYAREILETAADLVNGPRNADYGDARDNFTETGQLWAVILGVEIITAEQVALCMNQLKVARLIHNTGHADSWVDGAGYLGLGGGIAQQTANDNPFATDNDEDN